MSRNDLPPSSLRRGFRVPPRRQDGRPRPPAKRPCPPLRRDLSPPPRGDQPRSPRVPSLPCSRAPRETRRGRPAERPHNISAKTAKISIVVFFGCCDIRRQREALGAPLRREARSRRPSVPAPWRGPLEPEAGWSNPPSAILVTESRSSPS